MAANCESEFNDFASSEDKNKIINDEKILLENIFEYIINILDKSNIAVSTCFKKSFKSILKYYSIYKSLYL